jgi:thioredoxin reductase
MSQLFKMDGCNVVDDRKRGGQVPVVDDLGETSIPGIFARATSRASRRPPRP